MSKTEKLNLNILNKTQLLQQLNKNYDLFLECELKLKESSYKEMITLKKKRDTLSKMLNKILDKLKNFEIFLTVEEIRSNKISILEL